MGISLSVSTRLLTDLSKTDICAAFKSLNFIYQKPFIIGDGKHYGGYYNRPLHKHLLSTTSVHIGYVFENVSHSPDTIVILPTESRQSHAQAEFAGVHINNSRITPVERVCKTREEEEEEENTITFRLKCIVIA